MSLSIPGSIAPVTSQPDIHKAAPAPVPTQAVSTTAQTDTVTLSPAALKASQGGDVNHDGDSH